MREAFSPGQTGGMSERGEKGKGPGDTTHIIKLSGEECVKDSHHYYYLALLV